MVQERVIRFLATGRTRRVLLAIRAATRSPSISLVLISTSLIFPLTLYALLVWNTGPLMGVLMGVIFAAVYFLMTIVFGIIFYYKDNRELPLP
jgi:hypothetical protein